MRPTLPTPEEFRAQKRKSIALVGMSGVGKTMLAKALRADSNWFHYSVDFRIGTRYMGEHIIDACKREAMKSPALRELLLTDSIYIVSNMAFENLRPLSNYLGKPGSPEKGGLPFETYLSRQRQHREAEIAALGDIETFIEKSRCIYGYDHFLADTGGSIVEVVNPNNPNDPVLRRIAENALIVVVKGGPEDEAELARRFDRAPKPMYYDETFLITKWTEYLEKRGLEPDEVDPDDFIRWGFKQLLRHRIPRYQAIADNWGVSVDKSAAQSGDPATFISAVETALARVHQSEPGNDSPGF